MDTYSCFAELAAIEVAGVDYRIRTRRGSSGLCIVAPHGGRIERGTSPLAEAIAGSEHDCYCFDGIKPGLSPNRVLHVTSNHFDEPVALSLVAQAQRVITIHGARGREPAVYFGGLDLELRATVGDSLRAAGFVACDDPSPHRQGRGLTNICNRGRSGRGLQIELTYNLRKSMFKPEDTPRGWKTTETFDRFVEAVRQVL